MTTTPSRIASTIPAVEDSRAMCFGQGKACVYASEEDGRIVIAGPPGGVVEHLDRRTGEITDSGREPKRRRPPTTDSEAGHRDRRQRRRQDHLVQAAPARVAGALLQPRRDRRGPRRLERRRESARGRKDRERRHAETPRTERGLRFREHLFGRFAAQDRAHSSLERVRRQGGVHWHERSRDQHRARASTRQVRHRTRCPATGDHAAVVSSSEEPCRNGCVAPGHRRARQQPWHDETRREHHEGRNQVAGAANARVGAGVDPTDRTTPPSHMTSPGSSDEGGVRTEPCAVCVTHLE